MSQPPVPVATISPVSLVQLTFPIDSAVTCSGPLGVLILATLLIPAQYGLPTETTSTIKLPPGKLSIRASSPLTSGKLLVSKVPEAKGVVLASSVAS